MLNFIAHFTVVNGKFEWKNIDYMRANIPKFEGKNGTCIIKERWNKRSLSQNKYMWLCFEVLADYTGHTAEEIHIICKGLYCPKKEIRFKLSHKYMIPKGTSELTVGELVEFMLGVTSLASSLGCILPDPTEYQKEMDSAPLIND